MGWDVGRHAHSDAARSIKQQLGNRCRQDHRLLKGSIIVRAIGDGLAAQVANVYQDFAAGYFAFYITGPWNIGELSQRLPAAVTDRWTTAPMPSPNDTYPGVSVAGGASLAEQVTEIDRDPAQLGFLGHSLGGIAGTVFLAIEPQVRLTAVPVRAVATVAVAGQDWAHVAIE